MTTTLEQTLILNPDLDIDSLPMISRLALDQQSVVNNPLVLCKLLLAEKIKYEKKDGNPNGIINYWRIGDISLIMNSSDVPHQMKVELSNLIKEG